MKRIKKTLNNLLIILSTLAFLFFVIIGTFFCKKINDITPKEIEAIKYPQSTKIYDGNNNLIEEITPSKMDYIKFQDIPKLLIDALLSIEDQEFFYHKGINEKRILSSLVNNLFSSSLQGASTLTQQIIKNTMLTNERTYNRKIKEIYLSFLLEKDLSKEEILELYFNHVYFEKSYPGVVYASRRFFNKEVSELNLVEISILVGSVKSPSLYCPFSHPENANKRKNIVLEEMYKNNVITQKEMELSKRIDVIDLLKTSEEETTYKYQAYLDVVYQEASIILNRDIYTSPLKIETYLDTALQTYLDELQENDNLYIDSLVNIGSSIIKNSDVSIQGIIGGRHYKGKKIFNHASSLKASPASSIKPIFTYALGVEKYNLNQMSTLIDEEITYPNSTKIIHNADKNYLGYLSLIECLGYSRNTTTVSLCSRLEKDFSKEFLISYLRDINLFDEGTFSLSYALGGFTYGVSPLNMSGAYAMLANDGKYLLPSTIKRITSLENNEVLYERDLTFKNVLSSRTSSIITDSLNRVINANYYSIKEAKPDSIEVAGKTGTNAYDSNTIKKFNIPSSSDKDIWFCGYSKNYTIATWCGFDKIISGKKTYFYPSDKRRKIPKYIFKNVMSFIENKNTAFDIPHDLKKVYVVKHQDRMYYPNEYIPYSYIDYIYVKNDDEILSLPPLEFIEIKNVKTIIFDDEILIVVEDKLKEDSIYTRIFGERCFLYKIYYENEIKEITTLDSFISISNLNTPLKIEIYESFINNTSLYSSPYIITFT